MLTSSRGLIAATTFAAASAFLAQPLAAQAVVNPADEIEEPSGNGISVSANVTFASEYRFRGVDLSGGEFAIQGGFDITGDSGFYAGAWASSLDEDTVGYGSTELDVYGGWSGEVAEGLTLDVGAISYLYPDAPAGEFDYAEFYTSLAYTFGPLDTKVGIAYAPEQDSLGDEDNFYVYTDVGVGIPGTPVTVTGHLGYTDGFLTFTNKGDAFDWSIGAEVPVYGPLTLGAAYVGVEGDIPATAYNFTDDAFVVTLGASF